MAYVAGRRLDRAFMALCRPDDGRSSIAQVAFRSGFTSETHFSRSFRTRFAMTRGTPAVAPRGDCIRRAAPPSARATGSSDAAHPRDVLNGQAVGRAPRFAASGQRADQLLGAVMVSLQP